MEHIAYSHQQQFHQGARIVVAMSGGVDSSVAAAILQAQGYDVVGLTMQLYDHASLHKKAKTCCAGRDVYDARAVAQKLNIPHYVLDYESKFTSEVVEPFADSYVSGQTPVPCIWCNQRLKFAHLLDTARDLGADALATGHYVRRLDDAMGPQLHCARDQTRDQSYFLFATTREQLAFLCFPLGELIKSETRALAEKFDLPVADKPDSQDICFVPDGDYRAIVNKLRPDAAQPGEIIHIDGRVLGRHRGIIHYTIGQRRHLGVAVGDPLYVIRLDVANRVVYVGPREALATRHLAVRQVNWLMAAPAQEDARCDQDSFYPSADRGEYFPTIRREERYYA